MPGGTAFCDTFDFIAYKIPADNGCSWVGLAYVFPATLPAQHWIAWDEFDGHRKSHMHEIGHNLGFGHASTDWNNDGVSSDGNEYADYGDVMGRGTGNSLYLPFSAAFR